MFMLGAAPALGCGEKAPPAADVVPVEAAAADDPLRATLLELAVASECLRKSETPPEQMAATMLALYKAKAVDLETYTREMSRLAGDAAFQTEIDARARACPQNPDAPDAAVDAAVADGVVDTAAAPPDTTPVETAVAAADSATEAADTAVVVADTAPAPADIALAVAETQLADTVAEAQLADTVAETQLAVADTTPSTPELIVPEVFVVLDVVPTSDAPLIPIAETRIAEADTRAPEVVLPIDPPDAVDFSGTWTGQIGGAPGTLRVVVRGRSITSATATFGRSAIKLKGTLSEKGLLSLGGSAGDDFMRMSGKTQTSGRVINGTWDGVIEKRKTSGRFLLKR